MTAAVLAPDFATLADICGDASQTRPGQEPKGGFVAWIDGEPWEVRAVLHRTVVAWPAGETESSLNKRVFNQCLVWCYPGDLRWQPKADVYIDPATGRRRSPGGRRPGAGRPKAW